MSRESQQIRSVAIQFALQILPHVQVTSGEDVITLADKIAKYIEGERAAILVPSARVEMRPTVAEQVKEGS